MCLAHDGVPPLYFIQTSSFCTSASTYWLSLHSLVTIRISLLSIILCEILDKELRKRGLSLDGPLAMPTRSEALREHFNFEPLNPYDFESYGDYLRTRRQQEELIDPQTPAQEEEARRYALRNEVEFDRHDSVLSKTAKGKKKSKVFRRRGSRELSPRRVHFPTQHEIEAERRAQLEYRAQKDAARQERRDRRAAERADQEARWASFDSFRYSRQGDRGLVGKVVGRSTILLAGPASPAASQTFAYSAPRAPPKEQQFDSLRARFAHWLAEFWGRLCEQFASFVEHWS